MHERLAHHQWRLAVAAADGARARGGRHRRRERAGRRRGDARRPCDLFVPAALRALPLLLVGPTVLCIGHNDSPRWLMHDGTARVRLNGEPVNQMARIGTFAEEVVCPAEQVVKNPPRPAVHPCRDHRLQRRHRHRRGNPPCPGPGRIERPRYRLRRCRAQYRAGRPARRREPDHRLRPARQQARLRPRSSVRRTRSTPPSGNVVKQVRELTDGLGVDTAFDAIGGEATALQAVDAVAPGGRAVLVGIPAFSHARADQSVADRLRRKARSAAPITARCGPISIFRFSPISTREEIDLDSLISRTYRFDQINEGFRLMLEVPSRAASSSSTDRRAGQSARAAGHGAAISFISAASPERPGSSVGRATD